jgi:hypothetical protein
MMPTVPMSHDLAVKVQYSEESQLALDDFSPGGKQRIEGVLRASWTSGGLETHVHAGGMCLLVEATGGAIWVQKMSPFCLAPK